MIDAAVVAVVAGCVSFPLSIYYFNQFHLLSIPVNFVLVPFISFIVLPLGAVSLLVAVVWPAGGRLIARAAHYANDLSFVVVERLDGIKSLRTIWATPPLWWVAAMLFLLGALFYYLQRRYIHASVMENERVEGEQLTAPMSGTANTSGHASSSALDLQSTHHLQSADMAARDLYEAEHLALSQRLARTKRLLHCLLAALLTCQALLLYYAYEPNRWLSIAEVNVLNVGQGDAILIRTPGGKHMLVDGGGAISYQRPDEEWRIRRDPYEVGRKVVVPLLMKRGIRELDVLVISHLDTDHILGLQAVIDAIPIKEIWWNGTWKESDEARTLFRQAIAAQIPVYAVHAGMDIQLEAYAEVSVLWPEASHSSELPIVKKQNNSSVVLELKLYGASFVLSGDIDAATERAIIANHTKREKNQQHAAAAVLKVAHHGSRYSTSEEWLSFWRPVGAAVSVSATNSYGHPHPDVLDRLRRVSTLLWRTDRDGEISFEITGDGINVYN